MSKKLLNTDDIVAIAQRYADAIKDAAYSKLESEMRKRDAEVGGRGQVSHNLLQSIVTIVEGNPYSLTVSLEHDDYGVFVDEGVKGAESTYPESRNSLFQFKNKQPPSKVFSGATGWISRKAIIDRGEVRKKTGLKGKSLSAAVIQQNKSLAFLIARSIRKKGIKAYHFTEPIYDIADKMVQDISAAVGEDLVLFVSQEIDKIKKQ